MVGKSVGTPAQYSVQCTVRKSSIFKGSTLKKGTLSKMRPTLLAAALVSVSAGRTRYYLNNGWRFQLDGSGPPQPCQNPNSTFPVDYSNQQCMGLQQYPPADDATTCQNACCAQSGCEVWQWCAGGSCSPQNSCWIGALGGGCQPDSGWVSRGRAPSASPSPVPGPGPSCSDPRCLPGTDDSSWRTLNLPHDFVVEVSSKGAMALKKWRSCAYRVKPCRGFHLPHFREISHLLLT
jgi:hypothetical protein